MKPPYAIYLLESQWAWDHFNTEVATITVEGREGFRHQAEFERIIDPTCPAALRNSLLAQLKDIAQAQNQCMPSEPQLIRLYRVVDFDGVLRVQPGTGEPLTLSLRLELICSFDTQNNPTIPEEEEAAPC